MLFFSNVQCSSISQDSFYSEVQKYKLDNCKIIRINLFFKYDFKKIFYDH